VRSAARAGAGTAGGAGAGWRARRRSGERTGSTGQERGERLVAAAGRLGAQARDWPRLRHASAGVEQQRADGSAWQLGARRWSRGRAVARGVAQARG
jgi:hypothetical protein